MLCLSVEVLLAAVTSLPLLNWTAPLLSRFPGTNPPAQSFPSLFWSALPQILLFCNVFSVSAHILLADQREWGWVGCSTRLHAGGPAAVGGGGGEVGTGILCAQTPCTSAGNDSKVVAWVHLFCRAVSDEQKFSYVLRASNKVFLLGEETNFCCFFFLYGWNVAVCHCKNKRTGWRQQVGNFTSVVCHMTSVIISESKSTTYNNTYDLTKINHPNLVFMNIKHALDDCEQSIWSF